MACMKGVRYGQELLQHSSWEINTRLTDACGFLPGVYRTECKNKVSAAAYDVINKLVAHLRPREICTRVFGLCNKTAGITNTKHPDWLIARGRHGDDDVN